MCILLSITTLAIADIIREEEAELVDEVEQTNQWKAKAAGGKCHQDLISCLQILGDYESLLVPPPLVISAANQAAAKAIMFLSGLPIGSGYLESTNINDSAINFCKLFLEQFERLTVMIG